MKIYLACTTFIDIEDLVPNADILVAYPYIKNNETVISMIHKCRNFILDSGVFTMINSGKQFNLDRYVDEYADFIKKYKIRQYVELDVDQIIGVKKTRELRARLEERVGWRSIPVWHTIRGKESFIQDCKDYDYIALGYFLTEGLKSNVTEKYAKAFVDKAHEHNCRIHGLGFTKCEHLKNIPFDSVDSSTWSASRRYGITFRFDAREGKITYLERRKNQRMKNAQSLGRPAFIEWRKFQDFAYQHINPIWE